MEPLLWMQAAEDRTYLVVYVVVPITRPVRDAC